MEEDWQKAGEDQEV